MNKEIEILAKDICICYGGRKSYAECRDCFGGKDNYMGCCGIAERLYNLGYRIVIDKDILKELDYEIESLRNKTCENLSHNYDFVCSKCLFRCYDMNTIEIDDDGEEIYHYDYQFKFCPNCGRKVKY